MLMIYIKAFDLRPTSTISVMDEDDPSHPLFLHHGESPCAILISQPLVGENYPIWARSMKIALTAKNK